MSGRIVIVGAGVMGASLAWHLASRGHRDITIVDRAPGAGAGSTSKATGGFESEDREFFLQFSPDGYAVGLNVVLYALTH